MASYIALDRSIHKRAGWRTNGYEFAAADNLVSISAAEIPHLAGFMPLAFVQTEDSYALRGVQGFLQQNVFVSPDGRWTETYIPARYRTWPFAVFPSEQGDEGVLCVDEQSGAFHLIAASDDQPIFDGQGNFDPAFLPLAEFLKGLYGAEKNTSRICQQLSSAGVIEPWPIEVNLYNETRPVKGLFRINEEKLRAVNGPQLEELNVSGALGAAYGQLFSTLRLENFLARIKEDRTETKTESMLPDDISSLFASDDVISF